MHKRPNASINPPVFITSAVALGAFLLAGVFAPDAVHEVFPALLAYITDAFGWLYVLSATGFIAFSLWLLFGRYASVRLGDDDELPEFSTFSWFAMLFSAGMGIGLVFYGVAEPMMHFAQPPVGEPGSADAAARALPVTFFHWGIHAWAIYVVVALGIGYFSFRRKLPLSLRSCFYPLFGERIFGTIGHVIDVLAVFGTLFGLATSLGLGAMQVSAGLSHLFDIPHTTQTQLLLIGLITLAATISLVAGMSNGIRRLSELNLVLAALLLFFVFFAGPTGYIVDRLVEGAGRYVGVMLQRTLRVTGATVQEKEWMGAWTLFYWGWWISWAPFVGMFVARVSRGRTVRELVLGALLVPTGVTMLWFSVFGGTALWVETNGGGGIAAAVANDTSTAIYVLLEKLPLASVTSFLAALVVTVFFVTSSDSASFVVDMLTSGGHPNPPVWQRVFWASAEGATAAVLLYAGGRTALSALQAAIICIGLPFCLVIILLCVSLAKGLRVERSAVPRREVRRSTKEGFAIVDTTTDAVNRILVPIDRSIGSASALERALQLAEKWRTGIDVLHVAPRPADYLPLEEWFGRGGRPTTIDEELEKAAQSAIDQFVRERCPGFDGPVRVVVGNPATVIADVAADGGYDMIVMARNGARPGSEHLGTVTERVMRSCSRPVLTVC